MSLPNSQTRSFPAKPQLSIQKKLWFSLVVLVCVFAFVEVVLRIARIGEPPTIGVLRFGYDTGIPVFDSDGIEHEGETYREMALFEADSNLFWKPVVNTPFTGADGLRLPTPSHKSKGDGVYRIAIVGDSCSFLGKDVYPNRLAGLIEESTERSVEVVNASCPGYSSFQGYRRLQTVWPWKPDMLIVYFGWNDHWKSLNGQTDRDVMERQMLSNRARTWLGKSRIFWCMYAARVSLAPQSSIRNAPVRVPLDHYRANLQKILYAAEQHDCPTVFITAPSAYREARMPPWSYGFFGQFYGMMPDEVTDIPRTHSQYNDIVRSVAELNETANLLDVASKWDSEAEEKRDPERFRSDRIHLTEVGHQEIAEQLFELWQASELGAD